METQYRTTRPSSSAKRMFVMVFLCAAYGGDSGRARVKCCDALTGRCFGALCAAVIDGLLSPAVRDRNHQLGRLVSESAFEREDPGSNPAADMVDAARNTAWDLGKQPNNYRSNYPTQEWARSCGIRHNSVVSGTSPSGALNDGSLDSASSGYTAGGWRGGGGGSGGSSSGGGVGLLTGGLLGEADMRSSGLTMKEYDQHLARLNKENFALKLRVYFLEEKQGLSAQGTPALNKANIELKVENESLKRQLYDKQQLVSQASSAIAQLEEDYKQQMQEVLQEKDRTVQHLQEDITALQQSVREYSSRCSELEAAVSSNSAPAMSELTQLCDLAFPEPSIDSMEPWGAAEGGAASVDPSSGVTINTSNVANNTISNTLPATSNTLQQVQQQHQQGYSEHHHYHHHRNNTDKDSSAASLVNLDSSLSPSKQQQQPNTGASNSMMAAVLPPLALQGVFSLSGSEGNKSAGAATAQLQDLIDSLQTRVQQLQQQLHQRDCAATAVQQDMDNLRRELTLKEDEVSERRQHVEAMKEEMTEQLKQINDKDEVINSLHRDLERVEPEISIKVQEIEDRDRIIEEKIGQIEQQNKILVEIQITLDEKQKQITELETSLSEARERAQQLQADYDKSCNTITLTLKEDEVSERRQHVEAMKEEMTEQLKQINDKDEVINSLHRDLERVEPEISIKVQEIEDRDRIIEEKIGQIEQQNKILVEIQITLDEKQKQITELETSLSEARERAQQLQADYDKSCNTITGFMSDITCRDKEIAALKRDLKKKDRKIKDLVAELKETLDMLGKAKWEAETAGRGEDSVEEMVEEEHERLWAEMEQKKQQLLALSDELKQAEQALCGQTDELSSVRNALKVKEEAEEQWRANVEVLKSQLSEREKVNEENMKMIGALEAELDEVKQILLDKKQQLKDLQGGSDAGSDTAIQLDQLRQRLKDCELEKEEKIDALKEQLELRKNDITRLQTQLLCAGSQRHMPDVKDKVLTSNSGSPASVQVNITTPTASSVPPPSASLSSVPASSVLKSLKSTSSIVASSSSAPAKSSSSDASELVAVTDDENQTANASTFVQQINDLREALKGAKLTVTPYRNFPAIVNKYRRECGRLRHRLAESNNACDLLRVRLEELAEFLESILDLEERGLIDLSSLAGVSRATICKSLNDSRALSQTLSQSVLSGVESLLEEDISAFDISEEDIEEEFAIGTSFSFDVHDVSRYSCAGDKSLKTPTVNTRPSISEAMPAFSDIREKTQKIDDILAHMDKLNGDLTDREHKLAGKLSEIQHMRTTISDLEEKLANGKEGSNVSTLRSYDVSPHMPLENKPEVACQTLLAMAPRQSVSSLPDLSTSYLSSDSLSNGKMAPLIEESVRNDDNISLQDEESLQSRPQPVDANSSDCQRISTKTLLSAPAVLTGSGEATSSKSSPVKVMSISASDVRHAPASPSESEAWSEPDRNVSLARIGLETKCLAASLDRSRSRHSRLSFGAVHSSESDTEELLPPTESSAGTLHGIAPSGCPLSLVGPQLGTLMPGSAIKPLPKRRSDACEVRRLAAKLRTMEHLNETLKAELNIYQSLSLQLSPSSDAQQSDCIPSKPCAPAAVSSAEQPAIVSSSDSPSNGSCVGPVNSAKKLRRLFSATDDSVVLAAPLLQEIRSLRSKLEESISNNDQLRDQLEAAVLSCSRMHEDPSQLAHITAALLNAQETLQLTRDKLSFAQRCEQVQSDRCSVAERRADEEAKLVCELRAQLKEAQMELTSAMSQQELAELKHNKELDEWRSKCQATEKRLREAVAGYEESEAQLQERLNEATKACEESEARLREQHKAVSEVCANVQESTATQWPHFDQLHSALQASETQVLKVTRDRLVLLGEKSKLQAQLLSAQAQTSLLHESLSEEGLPSEAALTQQLQHVQTAVKSLQKRCSQLLSLNAQLTKEREELQEQLAGYMAFERLAHKSDITLESVERETSHKSSSEANADSRLSSLAAQQLQKNHSLLQEDYSQLQMDYCHLQKLYNVLQECEKEACAKALSTESELQKAHVQLQAVSKQCEEKLFLLEEQCSAKLRETEHKLQEAEQRFHDRMNSSELKLQQLQQQYRSKEQYKKLEGRLQEALQQLLAAEKTSIKLRTELQTLKAKQSSMSKPSEAGPKWSDNKENMSHVSENAIPVPSFKSVHPGSTRITSNSPQSAFNSPLAERQHSQLGTSGVMTSPLRHLRFSDPNLTRYNAVIGLSPMSPSLTDLLERPDDDTASRHSESPDLGLGSSDNGQMSSLERVMGHASSAQSKKVDHASLDPSYKLSPAKDKNFVARDEFSSTSDISGIVRELPIDVLISDRHSLPPDASGQLCAVQSHSSLASSNEDLSRQVRALQKRLQSSDSHLAEALEQLKAANARKQSVERAICRQLTKTHQVLRRAKGNMETRKDSSSAATAPDRHSSLT
ncbi:Centrosomin N-terminal motif 1 [Trinorchestia longiramus]|nr:Centrosomin N-terminal motif 1 [Trinorchestia longiramus]